MKNDSTETNAQDGFVHSGSLPTLLNSQTEANGKDGFVHSGSSPTIINATNSEPTITEFLAAFFPDNQEIIHLRAFKPKTAPDSPAEHINKYAVSRKLVSKIQLSDVLRYSGR